MENIQGISITDPTDSTLIQSRVLQLQLSCLQIPLAYFKPSPTMTDQEGSGMPEKTLRKRKETKHPHLPLSSVCKCVFVCVMYVQGTRLFTASVCHKDTFFFCLSCNL